MQLPLIHRDGSEGAIEIAPTKIIGVGRNYRAHAAELGNDAPSLPLLFFKPPSSIVGPNAPIVRPLGYDRVDYEGELAAIIGTPGRRIPRERALEHVLGFACLNDVTVRDLQKSDGQWTRAKGFDSFCPIGPRVVCGLDIGQLAITTRKNGEVVQRGSCADMVHSVAAVIAHISAAMSLAVGDIIATGTPAGVGPIEAGDRIAIEIDGIGVLENPVVAGE